MKRSVLIVAEGEHELSGRTPEAALITLVRRLLGDGIELQVNAKRIRELKGHMHPGRGDRLGRKFVGIVRLAEREGFDAVIILIDHDGDNNRLNSAKFAQDATITSFPRAIGIAVRKFDAWFLADETALSKVLCRNVDRQPDPEGIFDPKSVCRSLRDSTGGEKRLRDLYSELAAVVNLQTLGERCPVGFAVFAKRVESLKSLHYRD
ncbi:MAG: DUF4276 family protein [Planctomycetota bacterium]